MSASVRSTADHRVTAWRSNRRNAKNSRVQVSRETKIVDRRFVYLFKIIRVENGVYKMTYYVEKQHNS